MTKVDMSDYFFHYMIAPKDRKYFRFMFLGQKFQFTAMPFGLASAPRLATKMLQPVIYKKKLLPSGLLSKFRFYHKPFNSRHSGHLLHRDKFLFYFISKYVCYPFLVRTRGKIKQL